MSMLYLDILKECNAFPFIVHSKDEFLEILRGKHQVGWRSKQRKKRTNEYTEQSYRKVIKTNN